MIVLFVWIFGFTLFVSFFLIVFRGAPWVPTHDYGVHDLFEVYHFKEGEVLLDLGSGDGRVVAAAAERGIAAVGYELNPFLVWYSRVRIRKYKKAEIRLEDFWLTKFPDATAVVFVFLAKPFMKKIEKKMTKEAQRLGHDILLVSYGMEIPGRPVARRHKGMVVYRFSSKA